MKPQLLASSTVTTILFIILIFINKTSYGVDDDKFTQCKRGYGCGFIKDVRYPFWGDDTPSYCGRPGFKLSCLADGSPALNYGTLRFGVQEINNTRQMMRLTRNDLWGSSCPETFYNTTLDYSLFDYAQTVRNLTLFYNCTSQLPKQALNNFTCLVNGTQTGALYGNESFFRLNGLLNYTSSCSVSIQVPVFQTNLDSIVDGRVTDALPLRNALYGGFDVVYGFPESNNCSACEASGGVCGSNSTLLGFVCFCSNGTYPLQCHTGNVSRTGTTITLVNRCDYTVWPGVASSTSGPAIDITGFKLTPNSSRSIQAQERWNGRIWGRTGCNFDLESGEGSCATGDCNSTQVECNGNVATLPVTLAEFSLASVNNLDFYDVSLVDGYNLPMTVEASGGSGSCQPTGCITDVNKQCPPELQFGGGKACMTACQTFATSEYCCTGEYNSPSTCKPSVYSEMFKKACPRAYTYPYDDIISTFTCSRADYTITFCPSLTNLNTNNAPPPTMITEPPVWSGSGPGKAPTGPTGSPDWSGSGPGNAPTGFRDKRVNLKMKIGIGSGVGIVGILFIFISIYCFGRKVLSNSVSCWKGKKKDEKVEAFIRQCGFLGPKRFTYLEVKKITNSFKDKLGQGGFGDVYRGKLHDGRLVAAKVLNTSKGNGEDFINEVASISQTCHMNVVALLGFCLEGHKRALLYEFMPNGSLEKFIYHSDNPTNIGDNRQLGYEKLHQVAVGIAQGLDYLHQKCNTRILHFDIKPHNILLDEDFCPKISDFGLAKLCPKKESKVSMLEARGTIGYIAPEVFNRNFGGVSYKSDVYSYGMMVLEMVGGRKNLKVREGDRTSEIYFPHWIYKRLELDDDLRLQGVVLNEEENMIARKMILVGLWCIQTNPSNRPSMSEVINMLEGSIDALQIPPKPFLSSPPRSPANSATLEP